ncbi:hypothetical protein GCM10023189_56500 [Nibrella saemangeumensis]|uniref:Uncharacterized protein n=2 Tax=Nibrella saemangeumensis TaxID=1084526 RepID=A0ABP8NM28_9BACT
MGLAFTVDTPIKVARFGISSVMSIIEDRLLETMRQYYYGQLDEPYEPISDREDDYRARRVTDYLNLVNRIVQDQVGKLKNAAFEAGSELVRYFDMLPDDSFLKSRYRHMLQLEPSAEKRDLQTWLRQQIRPGSIDVNIMTKVDKNNVDPSGVVLENGSDALTALRGYANSTLTDSSVIFSAGLNPRLFNYLESLPAFEATGLGAFPKKVVIKVSDYRSALIQGKYLAKKGIWVSEFRIESGLNCGGHAFVTDGFLLGPILDEFSAKKAELTDALFSLYTQALRQKGKPAFDEPHPIRITVQGGIGTQAEAELLHRLYGVDSTGWGTPFLLVPEATTVDEPTLHKLCQAHETDVVLSKASPLGVRFYYLRGTSSEQEKLARIHRGKPGSPCTEKHLITNTEFTGLPICTASREYQKQKLAQLATLDLSPAEYGKQRTEVLEKECLCVGLSNSVTHVYNVSFVKKRSSVTICPGPNIAYFSKVVSLQTMTDHIYGRTDLISHPDRPHMFLNELTQYLSYLDEQQKDLRPEDTKRVAYCREFAKNLAGGIAYYRRLTDEIPAGPDREAFAHGLADAQERLAGLTIL